MPGTPLKKSFGVTLSSLAELSHARAADAVGPFFVFLDLLERQFDGGGYLPLAPVLLRPKGAKIAANDLVHCLLVGLS